MTSVRNLRAAAALVFVLFLAHGGAAQEPQAEDAAESRSAAFQAVEGPQKEQVPGGPLLVGAYGFVLVLLVGYVARLGLMQNKTASDVARLSQAIEQKRPRG